MTEDQAVAEVEEQNADLIDNWLEEATPDEVRVPLCMNRKLLAEFDQLISELEIIKPNDEVSGIAMMDGNTAIPDDPRLEEIQDRLVELKAAIQEDERQHTFLFRKTPRSTWRKILSEHPPTKKQNERFRGFMDYNPDTAGPAMVSASCVHPKMTLKQAEALQEALPENIFNNLVNAAVRVNRAGTEVPKSVMRTVDLFGSETKSTSPAK